MATILFICGGNSGRSQAAEGLFNHMTKKYRAISAAGGEPGDKIGPIMAALLKDIYGVDTNKQKPKALTKEMIDKADRIVAMCDQSECLLPLQESKTEFWEIDEMKDKDIDGKKKILAQIKSKVEKLIEELG